MERRSCCEPWGGPELSDGRWAGEVAAVGFQRRRRGPEPETCVDRVLGQSSNTCACVGRPSLTVPAPAFPSSRLSMVCSADLTMYSSAALWCCWGQCSAQDQPLSSWFPAGIV